MVDGSAPSCGYGRVVESSKQMAEASLPWLAFVYRLPSRFEMSPGDEFDATTLTVYGLAVDYSKIITIEPGKRSGKPCIRGLRITAYDVLDYLASGMTHEEILRDLPYLTEEDIQACLAFAADRARRTSFVAGEASVR